MKIILLGSNGQLGADIVRASRQYPQFTITALTRKNLDISHLEQITRVLSAQQFDVLINCTAYNDTRGAENDAQGAMLINAQAVARMAQVCEDKKAKFIHISTDYVFDGTKGSAYVETDTPAPLNVYGASKYLGETLARMHCSRSYVLRVASLFGVHGNNFVKTMLALAQQKKHIKVVDDVFMSPTGSASVARVILQMLDQEADYGLYHCVNSGQGSWYEFAKEVFSQASVKADLVAVQSVYNAGDILRPQFSVLDNNKLTADFTIESWQGAVGEFLVNR